MDAAPKDKWHFIYMTLILHGVGTLTGWNMFITAKDYFVKYKLADEQDLAEHYLTYVGWASQLPNLGFSWANVFVRIGGNLTTRIVWSLLGEVVIFVITVFLAMIDSSGWPVAFFWLTMISVFCLNAFNAIFQNSVYGVAARLPSKYIGAVVLGSNVCGTLVVFLQWMSDLFDSPRTSAIYYFMGGMVVLISCFDTYYALPLNKFYRHYDSVEQPARGAVNIEQNESSKHPPYGTIFKQSWIQLYNIFIVMCTSLTVFPAVHSDIEPLTEGFLGKNFVRLTCFFTFNFTAMVGSITATCWRFPPPKWLFVFSTVRLVFIPFYLLCNYKPKTRTWPVLIASDWVYWIGAMLMGWSSGHGSTLGMMYVGSTVGTEHITIAGQIGAGMLITGIFTGITFSRLCPILVTL